MNWNYTEQRRVIKPDRVDVLMKFTREGTNDTVYSTFRFNDESQITVNGTTRFNRKAQNLELKWSAINSFDIGDDSYDILMECIKAIRSSPDVTLAQGIIWYDTNFPDAIWKAEKFLLKTRQWIEKEYGVTPTWDQFKTYVINNVFSGTD